MGSLRRTMTLLSEQIQAEETAGMFKPHEHTEAGHMLTNVWFHPLDGVQPIEMTEYRAHKLMILRLLAMTGRCEEMVMEK